MIAAHRLLVFALGCMAISALLTMAAAQRRSVNNPINTACGQAPTLTRPATPTKAPDEEGFIRRWLILDPIGAECERRENGSTSVGGKRPAPKSTEAKPPSASSQGGDPEMAKLRMAIAAAPNTCEGQISAGVFAYITEIKNRRLLVIDEQKGLAVGFSNFYHDSKLKTMKRKGVPGLESVPAYQGVFNMPAIHFFKIKKGKIYDIEATGLVEPYGAKTGWE